jgi:hypothetical protein
MTKLAALLLFISLLLGCSTRRLPPAEPRETPTRPQASFPEPTESQSNQLARLDTLLRGPLRRLDLSWVSDMGAVAIPACAREARDQTLSADARDLILLVLGNALGKDGFHEHPDARNDLIVPVLLAALGDPEPGVRRSAAFAARFVDDARLVPALRTLLKDQASVQEQAVLALGMSGREREVARIAKLFFETDSGKFRYSCLYSLATMCLRHGVDVATVLGQNAVGFGEKNQPNVESVIGRFVEFKALTTLVRRLSSGDVSERRDADEKLRKLTGWRAAFDPAGNATARRRGIEEWQNYLLKDYWLVPPPPKP